MGHDCHPYIFSAYVHACVLPAGAVHFGLQPAAIAARRARYAYGVDCLTEYEGPRELALTRAVMEYGEEARKHMRADPGGHVFLADRFER